MPRPMPDASYGARVDSFRLHCKTVSVVVALALRSPNRRRTGGSYGLGAANPYGLSTNQGFATSTCDGGFIPCARPLTACPLRDRVLELSKNARTSPGESSPTSRFPGPLGAGLTGEYSSLSDGRCQAGVLNTDVWLTSAIKTLAGIDQAEVRVFRSQRTGVASAIRANPHRLGEPYQVSRSMSSLPV